MVGRRYRAKLRGRVGHSQENIEMCFLHRIPAPNPSGVRKRVWRAGEKGARKRGDFNSGASGEGLLVPRYVIEQINLIKECDLRRKSYHTPNNHHHLCPSTSFSQDRQVIIHLRRRVVVLINHLLRLHRRERVKSPSVAPSIQHIPNYRRHPRPSKRE